MADIVLPSNHKVENEGATDDGRLFAEDWNNLVNAVAYLIEQAEKGNSKVVHLSESNWDLLTSNDTYYGALVEGYDYFIYEDDDTPSGTSVFDKASGKLSVGGTFDKTSGALKLSATYNKTSGKLTL